MILRSLPLALAVLALAACGDGSAGGGERAAAISAAKAAYEQAVAAGVDLSAGPCIGNPVIPGWVADVAHDPRQPVDDDLANQCSTYRSGEAKHFIELDPAGNLIRAQ